jgi:dTDP-4-dehydrorhamnose 3,5-epimerase
MQIRIEGVKISDTTVVSNDRGQTNKFFSDTTSEIKEALYLLTNKGVKRGPHFFDDNPTKIITCLTGKILLFVIDIREGSLTEGKWNSFELSESNKKVVCIPDGCTTASFALDDNVSIELIERVYDSGYKSKLSKKSLEIANNWDIDEIMKEAELNNDIS